MKRKTGRLCMVLGVVLILSAAACALGMISGKPIFIFGIAERLRTLRYPIFTGRGHDEKRQLQRLFPLEMRRFGDCLISKGAANSVSRQGEDTLFFA